MGYYDSIAPGYKELYGSEHLSKARVIRSLLNLTQAERALDIGCGPSPIELGCTTYGLDPSLGLLRQSPKHAVCGAAEHLPFKDDSFDAAVSVTAMQNFTDPAAAVCEAIRVCRGPLVFTFPKRSPRAAHFRAIVEEHLTVVRAVQEATDLILITKYKKAPGNATCNGKTGLQ